MEVRGGGVARWSSDYWRKALTDDGWAVTTTSSRQDFLETVELTAVRSFAGVDVRIGRRYRETADRRLVVSGVAETLGPLPAPPA